MMHSSDASKTADDAVQLIGVMGEHFSFPRACNSQGGTGLVVRCSSARVLVAGLIPGGPAHRSQLISLNDTLLAINCKPIAGFSHIQIASMLAGDVGSSVLLTFMPQDSKSETVRRAYDVYLCREQLTSSAALPKIELESSNYHELGSNAEPVLQSMDAVPTPVWSSRSHLAAGFMYTWKRFWFLRARYRRLRTACLTKLLRYGWDAFCHAKPMNGILDWNDLGSALDEGNGAVDGQVVCPEIEKVRRNLDHIIGPLPEIHQQMAVFTDHSIDSGSLICSQPLMWQEQRSRSVFCDDFVAKSPSSPTAQPHPFSQAKPVMENNMAEGKFLEEQSLPAPCSNLIDRLRKYFGLMRQNWARESIIRRATCQSQGNRNLNFRSMPAIMLHWSLATCVRSGQRKVLHRCFKRRQGRLLRLSWNIWCENSISCSFEGWKTDKSEMMKRKLKLRVLAAFTIIQDGEFLSNLAVYKSTNCDSGRRYSCLQFGFIKQKDSFDVKFFNTIQSIDFGN